MTLTRLRLAQFRSWANLALDLDARPVAIFGPNGAGKTNILEAISMLAPGRGLRAVPAPDQARIGPELGWRIAAQIGDDMVQTGASFGTTRREVFINDKPAPQTALAGLVRIIWLVPAMDRLWTDSPDTRRRYLDRITLSICPDHAEVSLGYDKAMRERNRLLRDQVRDPGWYRALEARMAEDGALVTANRLAAIKQITQAQSETTGFPTARLTLLAGEGFSDDPHAGHIAARLADMRPRDMMAGRSLTGPHRADLGAVWGPNDMPASLSSTGEQKALLLSLILANARALADARPILLLDEVAAHLDGDRRAALYDQIAAMKAQAFLTGTGGELFSSLAGRARFWAAQSSASGSQLIETDEIGPKA